jgi:pyruvate-formate lyase
MKKRVVTSTFPLCVERLRIAFDVMERMKGKPILQIRSQIHADILDKMSIAIEPDDIICGVGASKPNGIEMDYENGPWNIDEVEALKDEVYTIDPADEAELYMFMERFEKGNLGVTQSESVGNIMGDERTWAFMKSGITPPAWKDKKAGGGGGKAQSGMGCGAGAYLMVPDFPKILNEGARAIIAECREKLKNHRYFHEDSVNQRYFWEGVIMVFEAWIRFANRYAELAEKMAGEENDPLRAKELLQMAEICRRVPENPAASFREAVQSFWFTFLLTVPSPTASAGRFDQYMYPFYKKDTESGAITDDEVLELLEILRLKDFQLNRINGKEGRLKNAGMAKWHNWTLGGCDKNGSDVSNELTLLEFRAAKETNIPHHTITLRVNGGTSLEVIVKALEVVKTGMGMPAFVGDQSYINFFVNQGVALEDARDYCMAGCVDGVIPGVTRVGPAPMFIVAMAYDIFMHNGFLPMKKELVGLKTGDVTAFKTFEEYKEAFFKQLHYLLGLGCERFNVSVLGMRELTPEFFRSALMRGGIEEGKDMMWRHMKPYDSAIVCSAVGVINVADSMAAVKSLIYDRKKYTIKELVTALDANWEGYENMHADFLAVPKFGNNDDLPDAMAHDIYEYYAKSVTSYDTVCGGKVIPNAISITAHQPGGLSVGALPDGRKAGEILADASLSPAQGRDVSGPLAVFQSAMKVDQDAYQATLMNMKFHPSALKTEDDLYKLASVIKTYLTNGGKHIQFNVVERETLEAAQKEPEKHRDLIVRVAGYSAYFTLLTPLIQQEVMDRVSYEHV